MLAPKPLTPERKPTTATSDRASASRPSSGSFGDLHAMQRAIGNHAMGELLRAPPVPPFAQAKLTVGAPNDAHEREADSVAQAITSAPPSAPLKAPCKCGGRCSACKKPDAAIQRATVQGTSPKATLDTSSVLAGLGAGEPLDTAARAFFEPRFGVDFSHVRVHTGDRAARSADSIHAHAYTAGRDIVFGEGRYAPHSHEGQRLLAHELTHVVQQGEGRARGVVQRRSWTDGVFEYLSKGCISESNRATEEFAKAYAKRKGKPLPGSYYDAFGHCFTACCVTRRRSRPSAYILGRGREQAREWGYRDDEDGDHDSLTQDVKNQEIGRQIGAHCAVPCEYACGAAVEQREHGLDLSAPVTRHIDETGAITFLRQKVVAVRINAGGQRVEQTTGGEMSAVTFSADRGGTHIVIAVDVAGSPSPLLAESVTSSSVQLVRKGESNFIPGTVSLAPAQQKAGEGVTQTIQWISTLPVPQGSYQLVIKGKGDAGVKSEARIAFDGADTGAGSDFVLPIEVTKR